MAQSRQRGQARVLKTIVVGGSAASSAGAAVPACGWRWPRYSHHHAEGRWIRIARLADSKDGEPKRVPVISEVTDAWTKYAERTSARCGSCATGTKFARLSVTCPHLGCGIEKSEAALAAPATPSNFDPAGKRRLRSVSARHGSARDARGRRRRRSRHRGSLQKFRQGIPEREEIG